MTIRCHEAATEVDARCQQRVGRRHVGRRIARNREARRRAEEAAASDIEPAPPEEARRKATVYVGGEAMWTGHVVGVTEKGIEFELEDGRTRSIPFSSRPVVRYEDSARAPEPVEKADEEADEAR